MSSYDDVTNTRSQLANFTYGRLHIHSVVLSSLLRSIICAGSCELWDSWDCRRELGPGSGVLFAFKGADGRLVSVSFLESIVVTYVCTVK